jgi:mannose-6-phosphate isomerase-like protein (cupin superfamily)
METGVSYTDLVENPTERFVPLRRELGVSTFGMNQMVLHPGERGRIHSHIRQEEVFLVLEGTLTLIIDGDPVDLPKGRLVRVAPQVRRQLVNRGPGRLMLLALGGAVEHDGRDGQAFVDWTDTTVYAPQDIPAPEPLPADELRT